MMRALWGWSLVLAACGGQSIALAPSDGGTEATAIAPPAGSGHRDASVPVEAEAGSPPEAGSTPDAGSPPLSLEGTWTGYLEAYQFPDGSDTVRITIALGAGGEIAATVRLGDAPVLPTPTAPDMGPVPGVIGYVAPDAGAPLGWGEAFDFSARPITFENASLSLGLSIDDQVVAWCAIQTHIYGWQPDGGGPPYGCVPNWPEGPAPPYECSQVDPASDASVPVDCEKLGLCFGAGTTNANICECSATECHVEPSALDPDITLTLQLSGQRLDGTIMGAVIGSHNVHLTKSMP